MVLVRCQYISFNHEPRKEKRHGPRAPRGFYVLRRDKGCRPGITTKRAFTADGLTAAYSYSPAVFPGDDGILDRLVHNSHRIEMRGDSMRKARGKSNT